MFVRLSGLLLIAGLSSWECQGWDYEGHRIVNQLALASLPTNFPAFVLTPEAKERVAFLAGEPDRWRNNSDLSHINAPDHFIDLDELDMYGVDMHALSPYRYDFVAQLALARAGHPDKFPLIDPDQNRDHTRQLVGFLPWAIMENYNKLKSSFSYLKTFEKYGTPEEVANAQQDVLYIMGVMGHYVGDASQPLHTTKYFNGWVGENPQHYTTAKIHSKVDGYFFKLDAAGLNEMKARIHPAQSLSATNGEGKSIDTFTQIESYILEQHKQVEPLYKLEKEGKLFGEGEAIHDGKAFLTTQIIAGGQMLGNIWYSAWQQAAPDSYLRGTLEKRNAVHAGEAPKP
ncbi:MAG: hypothetical protein JWR19_1558 [Pedosphaera sp.]|nr:hypothetical protein [Pedosphaera sp.]